MRYRISEDAERDLDEIFVYLAARRTPKCRQASRPHRSQSEVLPCWKISNLLSQHAPGHRYSAHFSRCAGSKTRSQSGKETSLNFISKHRQSQSDACRGI